jgi:predicted molibdopterin-dependent oxidoreductase YjgC
MARRIDLGVKGRAEIAIKIDGKRITAFAGESVAAAILAAGIRATRSSPNRADPRGPFCFMGSCQECLVLIDGQRALACQQRVADGLSVETETRHE